MLGLKYKEYAISRIRENSYLDLSSGESDVSLLDPMKLPLDDINEYYYTQETILHKLLSLKHKTFPQNIILTAGSDKALQNCSQAFISPGDSVIVPVPTFGRYSFYAKLARANIYSIKFNHFPYEIDTDKIIKEANGKNAKIIYLANPNNPTGHLLDIKEIEKIAALTKAIIIIDNSLIEYCESQDVFTYKNKNIIDIRTFSKIYGLAGARIGYAVVRNPCLLKKIKNIISPFEVSVISAYLAEVALAKVNLVEKKRKELKISINYLKDNLPISFMATDTCCSMIIIEAKFQINLAIALKQKGILVISGEYFHLKSNCVRVTIKNIKSMAILIKALESIWEEKAKCSYKQES